MIIPEWIKVKHCRKVLTVDSSGVENGYLVDILSKYDDIFQGRNEERFEQVYYSSVLKGMFKGFHIHPHKYDSVTCVYGKALLVFYPKIIAQTELDVKIDLNELIIIPINTEDSILTVSFPSKYPHGYFGVSDIAHILNYRNPAWHAGDKYQYDYKNPGIEEYLENWLIQQ